MAEEQIIRDRNLALRLKADCSRCAGLCCVVPAFDKGADFAVDKAAETPCHNLSAGFHCGIHSRLNSQGFSGCVAFDCTGAGQRVVHEIFSGTTWRNAPAIAKRQFACFRAMRAIHEKLLLLHAARGLPLNAHQKAERDDLLSKFDPAKGWTEDRLLNFELDKQVSAVARFLSGLRDVASDMKLHS